MAECPAMAAPTPMPHISDWRKQGLRSTAYMKFQGETRAAACRVHTESDDEDIQMSSQMSHAAAASDAEAAGRPWSC